MYVHHGDLMLVPATGFVSLDQRPYVPEGGYSDLLRRNLRRLSTNNLSVPTGGQSGFRFQISKKLNFLSSR
jgi:hypothetical protein